MTKTKLVHWLKSCHVDGKDFFSVAGKQTLSVYLPH